MNNFQNEKNLVREYFKELENASSKDVKSVLDKYTGDNYFWRGVYPFREIDSKNKVAEKFWMPLKKSLKHMQRRQDIFFAGQNELGERVWVFSMGHFMGLFDEEWLGVRPTGKMHHLRYAEFNCIEDGKIVESGIFVDIIGFMQEAGINPLPPSTGKYFVYPGPRDHNGLLFDDAPKEEGEKTLALVNEMVDDLSKLNQSKSNDCPPEVLEKTWSSDMIWYGPAGIGASYTIPRYQKQHQLPFRKNLKDKRFNGHVCRLAEGNFACFFGWPNLSNTPTGGFLGLPGGEINAEMQVVDVYYRKGEELSENWVFIDIPYWLKQQGLDIIERTQEIKNPKI